MGLTGGIGSGKTTVCKVFRSLGIHVYDADSQAKQLMNFDPLVKSQLMATFGEDVFQGDQLNRTMLAKLVFNDEQKLAALNAIVHPAVGRDFESWLNGYRAEKYIIKEATIMFESGSHKSCDVIIGVVADNETRIERVMSRGGQTREEVISRMNNQMDQDELQARVDYVIDNNGQMALIPQVLHLHDIFLSEQ